MIQAGRFRLLLMIGCVGNGASCPAESGGRSPFHQEQAHAGQSAKMAQLSKSVAQPRLASIIDAEVQVKGAPICAAVAQRDDESRSFHANRSELM